MLRNILTYIPNFPKQTTKSGRLASLVPVKSKMTKKLNSEKNQKVKQKSQLHDSLHHKIQILSKKKYKVRDKESRVGYHIDF